MVGRRPPEKFRQAVDIYLESFAESGHDHEPEVGACWHVNVGANTGSNGTYNLKGGAMTVTGTLAGGAGTSAFNFTGGTLKVSNVDTTTNAGALGGSLIQQNSDGASLLLRQFVAKYPAGPPPGWDGVIPIEAK